MYKQWLSLRRVTMFSRAKLFGHPIHPMLVGFPVALYTATLACFIVYAATGDLFWFRTAVAANVAGVAMGLVAAIPGFIDWATAIPRASEAHDTGLMHMELNLLALLAFGANAVINASYWRDAFGPDAVFPILLSVVGMGFVLGAGWLGWTLVQTHHVGIEVATDAA